jgi:hypothetical protein
MAITVVPGHVSAPGVPGDHGDHGDLNVFLY